jgi:hypothetical protein
MTGGSTTSPRTSGRPRADRRRAGVVAALRVGFAALLLVSGVAKLVDFPGFASVVGTYEVLPGVLLAPAALALTAVELAIGVWLLSGRRLAGAALVTVALHLLYLAWLAAALARGLDLPNCGCFGVFWARPLTPWMLLEDGALLALALTLYWGARHRAST